MNDKAELEANLGNLFSSLTLPQDPTPAAVNLDFEEGEMATFPDEQDQVNESVEANDATGTDDVSEQAATAGARVEPMPGGEPASDAERIEVESETVEATEPETEATIESDIGIDQELEPEAKADQAAGSEATAENESETDAETEAELEARAEAEGEPDARVPERAAAQPEPSPASEPAGPAPKPPQQPSMRQADEPPPAAVEGERQLVVFVLGQEYYGVDIGIASSIIELQPITAVPGTPSFVEGVTNLRGSVLPVIDLRKRLGLPAREATKETRIVLVEVNRETAGMLVDAVTEVLRVPLADIEPPSPIVTKGEDDHRAAYITGIAKDGERLIILLDLAQVFSSKEQTVLEAV